MPYKDIEKRRKHHREYQREWRRRPGIMQRIAASNKRTRAKVVALMASYKATLVCGRCPETHPACLEFHHLEDNKEVTVGEAIWYGWSWQRILGEIQKCIVLCSNCHRKEHYKRT